MFSMQSLTGYALDYYKIDYHEIWKNTDGDDFHKALEVLRVYCGYNESFYSTRVNFNHTHAVKEVVAFYLGEKNYLKQHEYTLVCNIVFLIFQVLKRIPRDKISKQGDFSSILNLFENKFFIKADIFYENIELLNSLLGDISNLKQDVIDCYYWHEFILKNIQYFPLSLTGDGKNLNAHPLHFDRVNLFSSSKHSKFYSWSSFYYKYDLINILMKSDNNIVATENLRNLYQQVLIQLPRDQKELLFEQAVNNHKYSAALEIFCIVEKLPIDEMGYYCLHEKTFISEMLKRIKHPISDVFIMSALKLKLFSLSMAKDQANDDYRQLMEVIHLIQNGNEVLSYFVKNFTPNVYVVFFNQFSPYDYNKYPNVFNNILATKGVNLRDNSRISYGFSEYSSASCWVVQKDKDIITKYRRSFMVDQQDEITMTPLQAVLHWASSNSWSQVQIKEMVSSIIKHDPFSVDTLDSVGLGVEYYLDKFANKLDDDGLEKYRFVLDLIVRTSFKNKLLFACFLYLKNLKECFLASIPSELIHVICTLAEEEVCYKKQSISYCGEYSSAIADLNHQQFYALLRYEIDYTYVSAVLLRQFAIFNKFEISKDDFLKLNLKEKFIQCCQAIKKPVDGNFFLIFFDSYISKSYAQNNNDYEQVNNNPGIEGYFALLNIIEYISGSDKVESKFVKLFEPDYEKVIQLAFSQKKYSLILFFLKELINTPDRRDYWYQVMILLDEMVKHVNLDKDFLRTKDNSGKDICYYLGELRNLCRVKDYDIKKIDELRAKSLSDRFYSTIGLLFHHSKIPGSVIPRFQDETYMKIVEYAAAVS